jgi:hypothetical protein
VQIKTKKCKHEHLFFKYVYTENMSGYKKDPRIDEFINSLQEWQSGVLNIARDLIHEAGPDIEETIKRTTWPFFVLKGNVCAFFAARDHINILIYDPDVPDPDKLINQGHGNSTAKAIQIYKGDELNSESFKRLISAVSERNKRGGWRKLRT